MYYKHFNEDYQVPNDSIKPKIEPRIQLNTKTNKTQFKLHDKAHETLFSSYNTNLSDSKHKRNRDSNSIMNNMTLKNPLTKTMVLERNSSLSTKQSLLKDYTNNNSLMLKRNPTQLINHKKNKSTIVFCGGNQIDYSIENLSKPKVILKKTEAFKNISKTNNNDKQYSNLNSLIKTIINNNHSRSRSKSNLDQTNATTLTKTSSDPATTTSKRLFNDNLLKTSAHKIYIDNFKSNLMKNLSSSLMTQLQKKKANSKENSFVGNYSNIQTEVNEMNHNINTNTNTTNNDHTTTHTPSTNTEILKTIANSVIEELEPITLDVQEISLKQKNDSTKKIDCNNSNSNQPSSGTIITEDSPFTSKPQSNSNTNNNSFSFKQLSNKQSLNSSINPNEKKSLGSISQSFSLSKSNSGQDIEETVSYTYSDDQITERKMKRESKKSTIDQDDFKAFTMKINERLKHL